MSASPIGALLTDAREKARKKERGHTSLAEDCTCEVEVVFFSEHSRRERMSRCAEHAHPGQITTLIKVTKKKGV